MGIKSAGLDCRIVIQLQTRDEMQMVLVVVTILNTSNWNATRSSGKTIATPATSPKLNRAEQEIGAMTSRDSRS
jgi:hypothetical protein